MMGVWSAIDKAFVVSRRETVKANYDVEVCMSPRASRHDPRGLAMMVVYVVGLTLLAEYWMKRRDLLLQ
jgi:hypothetical protein